MKFRCEKYPRLAVTDGKSVSVRFADGEYETDDKAEVAVLKRAPGVEIADEPKRKRQPKPKGDEKPEPDEKADPQGDGDEPQPDGDPQE